MRSIKELLELMLENQEIFAIGLCAWAAALEGRGMIKYSEYLRLVEYIENNRPSPYSSLDAWLNANSLFYWKKGKITPRIKWTEKHIKLNSKK